MFEDTEVRARSVLHAPKSGKTSVLLVTDGLEEGLTGTLVYCVKADATKDIKMRIIADVCYFARFNHISSKYNPYQFSPNNINT